MTASFLVNVSAQTEARLESLHQTMRQIGYQDYQAIVSENQGVYALVTFNGPNANVHIRVQPFTDSNGKRPSVKLLEGKSNGGNTIGQVFLTEGLNSYWMLSMLLDSISSNVKSGTYTGRKIAKVILRTERVAAEPAATV